MDPTAADGPLVFVESLRRPEVSAEDLHHLRRVLRLHDGDVVAVSDGAGCWRRARLSAGDAVEVEGEIIEVPAPAYEVAVGFALVKGERPELVVQKLTELGVDVIQPFVAARSVVRWDDERAERNQRRLERVAREACSQSRRCRLPVVAPLVRFADLVGSAAGSFGAGVSALAQMDGDPPRAELRRILVGPEGGWSPEELSCGLVEVRLARHVLRAETAAMVAGSALAGIRDASRGPEEIGSRQPG